VFSSALELGPHADASLAQLPNSRGVFAIFGREADAEPYISHSANLRRRLQRLLGAEDASSKRLNLRSRATRIEYAATGSPLESLLLLYAAYPDPRQRLKLRPPPMLRCAVENNYPRVYVTTRLSLKAAQHFYGPFASRVAAENYLDSLLDLFLLRRCQPDLEPDPAFPGCIYSEMHKCLAPCFKGCTDDRYKQETEAVCAFLDTRGESLLREIGAERDAASADLDFEKAAALHQRYEKAKVAAQLAPELARPLTHIQAVLIERSVQPESVTLFLFTGCRFFGPVEFSTVGMRHGNEQSKSSSLFVQPMQIAPLPLEESGTAAVTMTAAQSMDARLTATLDVLLQQAAQARPASSAQATDHLALLRRWFYRPESQKTGEIFFATEPASAPGQSPQFPLRRILRGISRVVTGQSAAQAKPMQSEVVTPAAPL
jgi:hypothetical protein